ncbi:leucyl/phenylalanyl-tRNA--protein transferase [Pontivivens insulae]|uniref:Leucyl/phenylalanyl-tRNA--protein transferase n=1 Tax=Pontivivens insulae TaxID=1639689 RepID=A0A2R8AB59_9RHOB|nr:leucyl/phenylalanyl-tRNA--protein transferase [Pontivivens insulae]RED11365.1 leucyl/phenylalanyl-tRNA--protein transferase [Pontivivens insulae]SPF29462.1 Leucyl/phenylalanyl-tRNA--protein transferase [Pontivivens insulae]
MRDDAPAVTAELLLNAYAAGVFPMAETRDGETRWVDPTRRGIIPLDGLHISRSLKKRARRQDFEIRVDTAFADVVSACADRDETWINDEIFRLYGELHQLRFAHSVEVWASGALVGGLYGVRLGGAFFGESMFSRMTDASKLALVWLVARLRAGGFVLLDTQFLTDHLESMGGMEISRAAYRSRLARALSVQAEWSALPLDTEVDRIIALAKAA